MKHFEIDNIKKIISASILYRIFYWKNIVLMIGEIKNSLEQYYEKDKRLGLLEKEYLDIKSNHKTEMKINESLKMKLQGSIAN